jgi:hypothetical protein
MVKKHIRITDDSVESFQENDRIVAVYLGSEPDEGQHIIVEREFPDEPAYEPGTAGVATIENNYGVAIPNQAGVWVSRGEGPQFVLFYTNAGRRAMYPASMVSDFVPEKTMQEVHEELTKRLRDARAEANRQRGKFNRADYALRDLVADLHCIQQDMGRTSAMRTSAGATLLGWLRQKEER